MLVCSCDDENLILFCRPCSDTVMKFSGISDFQQFAYYVVEPSTTIDKLPFWPSEELADMGDNIQKASMIEQYLVCLTRASTSEGIDGLQIFFVGHV